MASPSLIQKSTATTLYLVVLPLHFILSYLSAVQAIPANQGLMELITVSLLIAVAIVTVGDRYFWRQTHILLTLCLLVWVITMSLLHWLVPGLRPEWLGRVAVGDLFIFHAKNAARILIFLVLGIFLDLDTGFRNTAFVCWLIPAAVVVAYTDHSAWSLNMPDDENLSGIYQSMGDIFAVLSITLLATLHRSAVAVLVGCLSLMLLYVIGSRSALYAFGCAFISLGVIRTSARRGVLVAAAQTLLLVAVGAMLALRSVSSDTLSGNRMLGLLITGEDTSWAFRNWQLAEGLRAISAHPIKGWYGSDFLLLGRHGDYIHSYLELWRQFGLGPFLIFLSVLFLSLRSIWLNRDQQDRPIWLWPTTLMVFALVEIVFARTWGSPYVFMAIGAAVSLRISTSSLPLVRRHQTPGVEAHATDVVRG